MMVLYLYQKKKIWSGILRFNFENKNVLITGSGRGIGEQIVNDFKKSGANVICISKTSKHLNKLKSKIGEKKDIFSVINLEKKNFLTKIKKIIKNKNIQIVINNVGGTLNITNPLTSYSEYLKVFNINLGVAVEINNLVLPNMIKNKYGRIVHISSISSLENQGPPSYCAAKAALNAYVRSVGRYVSKNNVIMTSILPGAVLTRGGYWDKKMKTDNSFVRKYLKERMASQRFGSCKEISNFALFLSSKEASFCPGSSFLVDGGQGRVFNVE